MPPSTQPHTHIDSLSLYKSITTHDPPLPHVIRSLETLDAAFRIFNPDNFAIAFNGGKDATVVLYLSLAALSRYCETNSRTANLHCLYLVGAPGESFHEVNTFVEQTVAQTPLLDCEHVELGIKEGIRQFVKHRRDLCAFVMGTRRTDPYSQSYERFDPSSPGWGRFMRVNPILDWSYAQVWHFLRHFEIPFCDMYARGYTSIGAVATTRPNPALKVITNGKVSYKPAWLLTDESLERAGRVKKPS